MSIISDYKLSNIITDKTPLDFVGQIKQTKDGGFSWVRFPVNDIDKYSNTQSETPRFRKGGYFHNLWETLTGPIKPFFDIDGYFPLDTDIHDKYNEISTRLINELIHIFDTQYGVTITNDDFFIAKSCRVKQRNGEDFNYLSIHMTITKYVDDKLLVFANMKLIKELVSWIDMDMLDTRVYRENGSFRLPLTEKFPNDGTFLTPLSPFPIKPNKFQTRQERLKLIKNYLVCPYGSQTYELYPKNKIPVQAGLNEIFSNHLVKKQVGFVTKTRLERNDPYTTILAKMGYDHLKYDSGYVTGVGTCIFGINHQPDSYSPTTTIKQYLNYNELSGALRVTCPNCKRSKLLACLDLLTPELVEQANTIHLEYLYNIDQLFEVNSQKERDDINTLNVSLSKLINDGGGLAIKSGLGTGKTQLVETLINKLDLSLGRKSRVCFVVPLRLLGVDVFNRFQEIGFENYLDENQKIKEGLEDYHRIIVCHLSLRRLAAAQKYDLIIYDEISTIIKRLNTKAEYQAIVDLPTDRHLYLDGLMDKEDYKHINQLTPNTELVINSRNDRHLNFKLYTNWDHFQVMLMEAIKDKTKTIAYPCKSKSRIVSTESFQSTSNINKLATNTLEGLYKSITGSTKGFECFIGGDESNFSRGSNLNEHLQNSKCKLLAYTSALGIGIDIQYKFSDIFLYITPSGDDAKTLNQMIGRIRNYEGDNDVTIHLIYVGKNMKVTGHRRIETELLQPITIIPDVIDTDTIKTPVEALAQWKSPSTEVDHFSNITKSKLVSHDNCNHRFLQSFFTTMLGDNYTKKGFLYSGLNNSIRIVEIRDQSKTMKAWIADRILELKQYENAIINEAKAALPRETVKQITDKSTNIQRELAYNAEFFGVDPSKFTEKEVTQLSRLKTATNQYLDIGSKSNGPPIKILETVLARLRSSPTISGYELFNLVGKKELKILGEDFRGSSITGLTNSLWRIMGLEVTLKVNYANLTFKDKTIKIPYKSQPRKDQEAFYTKLLAGDSKYSLVNKEKPSTLDHNFDFRYYTVKVTELFDKTDGLELKSQFKELRYLKLAKEMERAGKTITFDLNGNMYDLNETYIKTIDETFGTRLFNFGKESGLLITVDDDDDDGKCDGQVYDLDQHTTTRDELIDVS